MQLNKTYLYAALGLIAAAALTAWLVIKAPKTAGGSADNGDSPTLSKPRALAFDANGNIVVADSKNNRLWVQKPNGELLKKVGKLGTGEGLFREPCGVAVGKDGSVYVADTFYTLAENGGLPWGRVQKFSKDYKFKAVFKAPESGSTDLFGPRAIAVDPSGNVWLSDTGNHRLVKYDADGKFLAAYGKKGKGKGEFVEPFGLAFDAQGNAYVADRLNYRIQVLDGNGHYLREFKVAGWEDTQINVEPYVAIDNSRGFIYVSDPTKKKVHRYSLTGTGHKELSKYDGGDFSQPTGLAVAADGTLLVSDGNLARIVTLKP
jgi:DNA-binding beta-propeller fold protein YncE